MAWSALSPASRARSRPPRPRRKPFRTRRKAAPAGSSAIPLNERPELEQRFKEANKKGDGKLTPEEAQAGMPLVAKHFGEIDKDKKGYVTLDEIKAAMAASGR